MSEIKYHNYTAADVRAWLYGGVKNGLSEQVISKVRANAILHNPYLTNDMVVVVSATDGDKIVGFTAMFPEHLVRPNIRLSCVTTLYAHPDYAGEFIGYYVSKALHDTANGRLVIGSDITPTAVLIDKLLGLKADIYPRKRMIIRRTIPWDSLHHVLSSFYEPIRLWKQHRAKQRVIDLIPHNIQLEYTSFVDAEMYDFIVRHSDDSMFVRSQEMLNWIMAYPFSVDAPLVQYEVKQNEFCSHTLHRTRNLFKVYLGRQLIGICMLVADVRNANIRMLYVCKEYNDVVYAVLLRHVLDAGSKTLHSVYKDFNTFVEISKVAFKIYEEPYVFTHPRSLLMSQDKQMQGMDGDSFA